MKELLLMCLYLIAVSIAFVISLPLTIIRLALNISEANCDKLDDLLINRKKS